MTKALSVAIETKSPRKGGLPALQAQLRLLTHPSGKQAVHTPDNGDFLLWSTDEHGFLYDLRNLVIAHSRGCASRGSFLDRGKTFHNIGSFLTQVDRCGITLSEDEVRYFTEVFRRIRANVTY